MSAPDIQAIVLDELMAIINLSDIAKVAALYGDDELNMVQFDTQLTIIREKAIWLFETMDETSVSIVPLEKEVVS